jgi:hypothetical protein
MRNWFTDLFEYDDLDELISTEKNICQASESEKDKKVIDRWTDLMYTGDIEE